jgi:hypothetical protein
MELKHWLHARPLKQETSSRKRSITILDDSITHSYTILQCANFIIALTIENIEQLIIRLYKPRPFKNPIIT